MDRCVEKQRLFARKENHHAWPDGIWCTPRDWGWVMFCHEYTQSSHWYTSLFLYDIPSYDRHPHNTPSPNTPTYDTHPLPQIIFRRTANIPRDYGRKRVAEGLVLPGAATNAIWEAYQTVILILVSKHRMNTHPNNTMLLMKTCHAMPCLDNSWQ